MKGIVAKGFKAPSLIQSRALPVIINSSKSLIGQAQNGSGKTATFALGMLAKINPSARVTQGLVICPSRELVLQNRDVIKELGQFMEGLDVIAVVPNMADFSKQGLAVPILVASLGKIQDGLKRRFVDLSQCRFLVVDEVDFFLKDANQQAAQLQQLKAKCPPTTQMLLFSATFESMIVRKMVEELAPQATKIIINKDSASLTVNTICQMYCVAKISAADSEKPETLFEAKYKLLVDLYSSMTVGQSIIFVNTRKHAALIAKRLAEEEGQGVSLFMGAGNKNGAANPDESMSVEARDKTLEEFKRGSTKVLVATDVLARGIDVASVTLVVNFDLPFQYNPNSVNSRGSTTVKTLETDTYLHRIARTGRFGKWGVAMNLIAPYEKPFVDQLSKHFKVEIEECPEDPEELETKVKELKSRNPTV